MSGSTEIVDQLTAVDLFTSLSARELKSVASAGRRVEHAAGKEIVTEGGGSVGFHLVLEGEAEVQVGGAARPPLHVGQYFGEISLLDGKPRTASVTAGPQGVVTWSLTSWDFHGLLEKYPSMTKAIITGLCARLRAAEGIVAEARAATA